MLGISPTPFYHKRLTFSKILSGEMEYYCIVGKRVKAIRVAKGISIEKLSDSSGLTIAEIEEIEGGRADIKLGTFVSLSKGLEVCLYSIMPDIFFGVRS